MNKNLLPLVFSIAFIAGSQLTNSLLGPALPVMAEFYAVAEHQVQQLVVNFMLGLGFSQLIYGPLADAYGRRRAFWLGQSIFLMGNLIGLLGIGSLQLLSVGVFVQGLGAGSNQILARCLLSDSYRGSRLSNSFALLGMAASVVPVIAPLAGGFITAHFGWQALFAVVGLSCFSLLVVAGLWLPETHSAADGQLKLRPVLSQYQTLLTEAPFIRYSSFAWISSVGLMYMITSVPFVLQHDFGLGVELSGALMMIPAVGLALGGAANRRLLGPLGELKTLLLAASVPVSAAMILLLAGDLLAWVLIAMIAISLSVGMIYPISQTGLFSHYHRQAGTASALMGCLQMSITASVIGGVHRMIEPSVHGMTLVFGLMGLAVFAVVSMTAKLQAGQILTGGTD